MRYEVTMRCVVTKLVTVECETESLAWDEPWSHAIDEQEVGMSDWEVKRVEQDK